MRAYGWRVAICAIALLYPICAALGKLIGWITIAVADQPSDDYVQQMLRLSNLVTTGVGIFVWLVALIAAMEAMRASDKEERSLGRLAMIVVVIATLGYIGAFFFNRFMVGAQVG